MLVIKRVNKEILILLKNGSIKCRRRRNNMKFNEKKLTHFQTLEELEKEVNKFLETNEYEDIHYFENEHYYIIILLYNGKNE